jgi:response regulator RpfG family c-di-GMP phosphodiesterase
MKRFNIVHVDDHKLFQAGVRKCLQPELNNIYLQSFQYSDDAFLCIKNSLDSTQPVDLIITDLCHMGQNGYEFAKSIRRYECTFFIRIPILLLTMHTPNSSELIQKGLDERIFDRHLAKNSSCEQIWTAMETLMKVRRNELFREQ